MSTSAPQTTSSSIRLRPTLTLKAVGVGALFLALVSPTQTVSPWFLLLVLAFAAVDAFVGFRALRSSRASIETLQTVAEGPEQLSFQVDVGRCAASLSIEALGFDASDLLVEPAAVIPSWSTAGVQVSVAHGVPTVRSFVRFRFSATVLGLVDARRTVVYDPATLLYRGQQFPSFEGELRPVVGLGVGRLRPYVPGDRRSRVAWTTTARVGDLYIRDYDEDGEDVLVVLDLGPSAPASAKAQDQVSATKVLAGSAIGELTNHGNAVTLLTVESSAEFHAADLEAARTLASTATVDPADFTVNVVQRSVSSRRDLVERIAAATTGEVSIPPGPLLLVRDGELIEVR